MIVKDEERYLDNCLKSVKDIVDEIIIVDTGSTDRTLEIARKYTDKIYSLVWNNDFAAARNFSISKAQGEWILILDGDEVLNQEDKNKILEFVNTTDLDGCHFIVYNYIGNGSGSDYTIHEALRLFRNNKKYEFIGRLHEQISSKEKNIDLKKRFSVEDIRLYHYGYLDTVTNNKKKRERNIPILLEQIAQEPENLFHYFNLGNEYLAQKDYGQALEQYKKVYAKLDITQPYSPHLLYRMICCLFELKEYEKALLLAEEALKAYPLCTDIMFLKGFILSFIKRYTLAVDCFNKCIEMGEPPRTLNLLNGCATFRPYIALGDIYSQLDDLDKALHAYTQALNSNNELYYLLYKIGNLLNKKLKNKREVISSLAKYFSNLDYTPNAIVYADILLTEGLYDLASEQMGQIKEWGGYLKDKLYLQGRLFFYLREYNDAGQSFREVLQTDQKLPTILPQLHKESIFYLLTIFLIQDNPAIENIKNYIDDTLLVNFCDQVLSIYRGENKEIINQEEAAPIYLEYANSLLEKLLQVKEFDLFEKYLALLNYIDSKLVLIELAKIYFNNGFKDLAAKTVIKSIKELDTIDADGLGILARVII